MYKIMVVDDEHGIVNALKRELDTPNYTVETFTSPIDALDRLQVLEFELVISDFRMPQMDGVVFLEKVKQRYPSAIRLILSGNADLDSVFNAINKAEIYRFITKPWNKEDLLLSVKQALEYRGMLLENKRLADQVRESQDKLKRHQKAFNNLKHQHPALCAINWGPDGSIIIDEEDVETGSLGVKSVYKF